MKDLDLRGLACPGPVLELRRWLDEGERRLRLKVADELARSNITRFAASRGAEVEERPLEEGGFLLEIRVADDARPEPEPEAEISCVPGGPLVLQVGSDRMGQGDPELGALLLRSLIKTQLQLERPPETALFYNAGVKLCCEGSPLLEDILALERAGTEVIACGTCLNFYSLAEKLRVGRVTDMLEIATVLAGAGATVRP
ncbi:MAG: sulfurtransferase-like selenium metabolism protein YedF [Acidobacteriota bacterium]|nr:sulfurtransferase-like selenium metabolism protein YedF [Acidobacteriota bacterium]